MALRHCAAILIESGCGCCSLLQITYRGCPVDGKVPGTPSRPGDAETKSPEICPVSANCIGENCRYRTVGGPLKITMPVIAQGIQWLAAGAAIFLIAASARHNRKAGCDRKHGRDSAFGRTFVELLLLREALASPIPPNIARPGPKLPAPRAARTRVRTPIDQTRFTGQLARLRHSLKPEVTAEPLAEPKSPARSK